jgi:hypothetical protein
MREAQERSFERMGAELAVQASELEHRGRALADWARQIDERAAAHGRALEHDRALVPGEMRKSVAELLPGMVAEAVRIAIDARRSEPTTSRTSVADEVRQTVAGLVPGMVAEAVDFALASRPADPYDKESGAPRPLSEHDPIITARQRSLEKRIDGLTRRDQEIDDRVTTHLRSLDDDRAALSELVRRQDQLERSAADAAGQYGQLVAWVDDAVPGRVADAVRTTLEAHAAALSSNAERAERVRVETETLGRAVQEASERIMETLYRRDQEVDERSAAQLGALEDQRAALAALLESGRDQIVQSVVGVIPAMVDDAVRTAMARFANERRVPALEQATRLRADSDIMREGLQRSFEKMMESLAVREQELDDRAAAYVRAVEHEKGELAEIRSQVAASLSEALPGMVAEVVRATDEQHRADLEAAHGEMARLRAESEAATTELREAVAEMRAAAVAQRAEAVERQAAASERALEGLRSAIARPGASGAGNGRPRATTPPPPPPRAEASMKATADPTIRWAADPPAKPNVAPAADAEPMYELETLIVEEADVPPIERRPSPVPRARRVERRLLRIDDRDDAQWRPLDRRQAALSDLLDEPGH